MSDDITRGKVSVSMSDELQQRTDQYAKEHKLTFSQVVQDALEQFLKGGQPDTPTLPPPFQPPPPPAGGGLDLVAREYVLALAAEVDMMRTSMQNAGLWVPPGLGPPPWYHRSPKHGWPPTPPT